MPVIGHGNVDDYDYIFPLGADEDAFDHHVVVFVVPAQDKFR